MMVRIANQDRVATGGRKVRRPFCSLNDRYVREPLAFRRLSYGGKLSLADISSENLSRWTENLCECHCPGAKAGADVRQSHAWLKLKEVNQTRHFAGGCFELFIRQPLLTLGERLPRKETGEE